MSKGIAQKGGKKNRKYGRKSRHGDWIAKAHARANAAGPTKFKTIEECLRLPRKIRRFGNVTYPKIAVHSYEGKK